MTSNEIDNACDTRAVKEPRHRKCQSIDDNCTEMVSYLKRSYLSEYENPTSHMADDQI